MEKDLNVACDGKSCDLIKTYQDIKSDIERLRKNQENSDADQKAGFAKFERKQDQILDIVSDYKAILIEIKNLKGNAERVEQQIVRDNINNREQLMEVFGRLNELEKNKADKSDTKESKGWFWAVIITIISILANFFINIIRTHLTGK